MNHADAVHLIAGAVPRERGIWADLGAGDGTFTRALADLLEPHSRVYAVDRDAKALATVARRASRSAVEVITVVADFTAPFDLPGEGAKLDGLLFANALHFARDAGQVLMRLASGLRSGGRVVIVEYDRRGASRWVPFPIPSSGLSDLMAGAGFTPPIETARQPSAYGGDLYVAYAERVS